MTVEGAYNEQARGSIRPHISALYTDTFLDNRPGWSIAVDINKRSIDDQQFATDGVIQDSTWAGPDTRYRVFAGQQNDMVGDRKSDDLGKRVSVLVDLGRCRFYKKKKD